MTVLSLDLGSVTGWAALTGSGELIESGNVDDSEFKSRLELLLNNFAPDYVVVEEPVIYHGPLGRTLQKVVDEMKSTVRDPIYVRPGQWKPHPMSQTPLDGIVSPHERDAIHLGMWYCKLHLQGSS